MSKRFFVTVDWCNTGHRGIFCSRQGTPFSSTEIHTLAEMEDILGPFSLILNPESLLLSEEEVATHTHFQPLPEYHSQFGIARTRRSEDDR